MNGERHVIDQELKALLEDPVRLFLTNRDAMKKAFFGQGALTHSLCALLCANRAALLDAERVKEMRALVRARTGLFSQFRGLPLLPLATLLSGSLMPESDLERVQQLYETLRRAGFAGSPYLVEAAFSALLIKDEFDAEACAAAAREMYKLQRKAHPFLGAQTTCMYAFLSAVSGGEPARVHEETERGYGLLKKHFPSSETTYALASVLTLGEGGMEEKCARVLGLYQALRARGLKYGRYYELPALGVLALLPAELSALEAGIADTDTRLRQEKGFSGWTMPASQRILYAASLYAITLLGEQQDAWLAQGLIQSVTGVLIAAQTAACISASAGAAAAAASSNGS